MTEPKNNLWFYSKIENIEFEQSLQLAQKHPVLIKLYILNIIYIYIYKDWNL